MGLTVKPEPLAVLTTYMLMAQGAAE